MYIADRKRRQVCRIFSVFPPPNIKGCRPRKCAGGAFYARVTVSLNSCPFAKCSSTPPPLRTAVQSKYSPMQ